MASHIRRGPRLSLLLLFALAASSAPAAAAPDSPDALPDRLPSVGARAAAAPTSTWIVGAERDPRVKRIAARHGAVEVGSWGAWVLDSRRARAFTEALDAEGLLQYSEPNRSSTIKASSDPLTAQAGWRDAVVAANLAPPPIFATAPLVTLIDSQLDASHPEFQNSNVKTTGTGPLENEHGTATAGVVSTPVNGFGLEGIWPNARTVNLPTTLTCADVVARIEDALRLRASVINMSYGSSSPCRAEYVALQVATARDVLLVAAAGNEFAEGNPLEFPASLPHVFTVAAAQDKFKAAYFSNANAAVDIAAPGVGILTTVPKVFDPDGDGYDLESGTSFAAPIVAGAAGWLRAARPDLDAYQVQQVFRATADDMGREGFDTSTGWGFIDLAGALVQRRPRRDPREPNDGITFVNGDAFTVPAKPIFTTRSRSRQLDAALDVFEDPHDVYRMVLPARRSVKVTVRPRFGDPDLKVFSRSARDVTSQRGLVARSDRGPRRTESVKVTNNSPHTRSFYVDVYNFERGTDLNSSYRLNVTLLKKKQRRR